MDKDEKHPRRWRVEFFELAYDGGGSSSWTQYYRTRAGAAFSLYWNVYIASRGGSADMYDDKKRVFCLGVSC